MEQQPEPTIVDSIEELAAVPNGTEVQLTLAWQCYIAVAHPSGGLRINRNIIHELTPGFTAPKTTLTIAQVEVPVLKHIPGVYFIPIETAEGLGDTL